jgi:hypothetical protein
LSEPCEGRAGEYGSGVILDLERENSCPLNSWRGEPAAF